MLGSSDMTENSFESNKKRGKIKCGFFYFTADYKKEPVGS
jgi:hypothetical protein